MNGGNMACKYGTVLLKLTGEVLGGRDNPLDFKKIDFIVGEIAKIKKEFPRVRLGIVTGGGNIVRGRDLKARFKDKSMADYMGMLATVINASALSDQLEKAGVETRVMSSLEVNKMCEPFIHKRATRHLEKQRIVIFAGGTGNTDFTTDSAAAVRAANIGANIILKGTKVDGVYSADPKIDPHAKIFRKITYKKVLEMDLRILDSAAVALAKEKAIPIIVFDIFREDNLLRILKGENIGSLIC